MYFKLAKAFEGRDWDAVEKIAEDESKEYEKVSLLVLNTGPSRELIVRTAIWD